MSRSGARLRRLPKRRRETPMQALTLWMQMSTDGYASGPNGAFDWPVMSTELEDYFLDGIRPMSTFVYGRKVFEMMAGFWPTAEDNPALTPYHHEYARVWKPVPKL